MFFGCGGDDDPAPSSENISGYYMKFKANGKEFIIKDSNPSENVMGNVNGGNVISYAGKTYYSFQVGGIGNQGGAYPILNMTIESKEKIALKEYKLDELQYSNANQIMFGQLPINDVQKKSDFYNYSTGGIITIKEITTTAIKGTFSGTIVGTTGKAVITDGEFFAKRTD